MNHPVNYLSIICEKCLSAYAPDRQRPYLDCCPRCWNNTPHTHRARTLIAYYIIPVEEPEPLPIEYHGFAIILMIIFGLAVLLGR